MSTAVGVMPSFFESLTQKKFSGRDQRRIVNAVEKLRTDPAHPSLKLEHLTRIKNPNLWSARVTDGIRIIIYRKASRHIICVVERHNEAYKWAECQKLTIETETAIVVETGNIPLPDTAPIDGDVAKEKTPEKDQPVSAPSSTPGKFVFEEYSDEQLLDFRVPDHCLSGLRKISSDEEFVDYAISVRMPDEANDILLAILSGETPLNHREATETDELKSPPADVKRKVYPIVELEDNAAFRSAMKQPWYKWLVFIDPTQKGCVVQNYGGPVKIYGSAGTGKTVVALHRAAHLARQPGITEERIHLLTFSKTLATDLEQKLELLIGSDTPERSKISVSDFETFGKKAFSELCSEKLPAIAGEVITKRAVEIAVKDLGIGNEITEDFLYSEYTSVIGPWGLQTLDEYLNFQRRGRKKQLSPGKRKRLWPAVEYLKQYIEKQNRIPVFDLFNGVSELLGKSEVKPADHVIIDECQDIGPEILKMIRSMVSKKENDIFLCGDLGQSLYRRYHSWLRHGIDIRGRSTVLRVNYRTSRQIKETADQLTQLMVEGEDGINEDRRAFSIFDGPEPDVRLFKNEGSESRGLADWLADQIANDVKPHEIVIISRTDAGYRRASRAAKEADLRIWALDSDHNWHNGLIGFCLTERSKGLEYKAVAVIGCDRDLMPLLSKIQSANDPEEAEEFRIIETNQLYVAMTRARESLYISGVEPGSVLLDKLGKSGE